jgi:hypothetical protein
MLVPTNGDANAVRSRTRAATALPQCRFPVTASAKDNRRVVAMINEPKAAVVVPWSARRQATRNIRRGTLPRDEPDRSRTIKVAREVVVQRWFIPFFAIAGPVQLVTSVFGYHEEILFRSVYAANGIVWLSLAVVMFLRLRGARVVLGRAEADSNRP